MNEPIASGNGKHTQAAEPSPRTNDAEIQVTCPTDLHALAPVARTTDEEVRRTVERARDAQSRWKLVPMDERIAAIKRAAKSMLRKRHQAIALARDEMGKCDAEGMFNEALGPLDTVTGWSKIVRAHAGRHDVRLNPINFPRKRAHVDMVPRGVVGIIAPWNYPVAGLYRSVIPALMTGNAVVLKPSEYTPRTSAWLAEVLASELPEHVIQVVQGDGRTGSALIDAGIDACVFTGSPKSGRSVRVHCAELGIPCSVEMGGKDPAIVLADCDLDRTAAGITHWTLSNAGQACGAIEIAYVDSRIADTFVDRLRRAWERLRVGPGEHMDIPPLANERQFDIVVAQVDDARAKGATVVCGGKPTGQGLFYPPTILDHCNETMSVVQDETFGPVLAVVRVDGAADAVRRTNAARYGLGVSIWTGDAERAERLAERLDVGVVNVNNHAFTGAIPALPWSGTRETGFGIANSPYSLLTFLRPRTVVVDTNTSPELFWLPYDATLFELGDILSDAQLGHIERAWKIPLLIRKRVSTVKKFFG